MKSRSGKHMQGGMPGEIRAALYLRVSTTRQAEGDVSLPSQRHMAMEYCERQGWRIVAEFVEPGVSGREDRRPAFQEMVQRACDPDHPFDTIIVHSFSRFYRDSAHLELTIRKLRKHGVELVSTSQVSGSSPEEKLIRQIIGAVDEHQSYEISKNTKRGMYENGRQGFWNGATPPLGYCIVEAERRGEKIKKKLGIDPVERETVELIFRLYAEGNPATGTPPLGVKATCSWLNKRGFQTKKGGTFGIGPLHGILTNTAYIGRWKYNVSSGKDRKKNPESEIIHIPVPQIIDQELFDRVQAKLAANNPRVTPPRVVTGSKMLTGIATCSHCGGGMTQRTGTSRSGKVYSYYACASRAQKGATACKGNSVRMERLDAAVVRTLQEQLFTRERLTAMLSSLSERRAARAAAVNNRVVALQAEVSEVEQKLKRLYQSIANGIVELDDLLAEQVTLLKAEREKAKAALERALSQDAGSVTIDPAKVDAFSRLMTDLLADSQSPALKAYLRSILGGIVVGEKNIRIIGSTEVLASAVTGRHSARANVRGFIPEWRARQDSNP